MNQGIDVRKVASKIKTRKVQVADPVPYIVEVKDIVSGSVNEHLTPGGVIQLRGSRLKFIEANATNGAFLLNITGAQYKASVVVENKPGRLIVMLPADLPPGIYMLEVRTTYSQSGTHECLQLKVGRYLKMLTVV